LFIFVLFNRLTQDALVEGSETRVVPLEFFLIPTAIKVLMFNYSNLFLFFFKKIQSCLCVGRLMIRRFSLIFLLLVLAKNLLLFLIWKVNWWE